MLNNANKSKLKKSLEKKKILFALLKDGVINSELEERLSISAHPDEIAIDVNNRCNLHCRHCDWGIRKLSRRELTIKETIAFVDRCVLEGTKLFAFPGREPFLSKKIIPILQHLNELKRKSEFAFGFVTNGTEIAKFVPQLKGLDIDYWDVSFDGIETVHDAIRGKGNYIRAVEGMRALREGGVRGTNFVSFCLNQLNKECTINAFLNLNNLVKATNFCILPYAHRVGNEEGLVIDKDALRSVVMTLISNERIAKADLTIMIDLEWYTLPLIKNLFEKGVLAFDELKYDVNGVLYAKRPNGNSRIYFKFGLVDFNHFVITADGFFGDIFIKSSERYDKCSSGNVMENDISDMIPDAIHKKVSFINSQLRAHPTGFMYDI